MMGVVIIHLFLLHQYLSSDSIDRFAFYNERVLFMYWFYFRDLNIMLMIMLVLQYFIYIYWSFVFHEESFLIVNPQKTPEKVMPEDVLDEALQERGCGCWWRVGGPSREVRNGVLDVRSEEGRWGGWKGVGVRSLAAHDPGTPPRGGP